MEAIGRYQILGELGRGAMGVVYRAQDPAIGRSVAIKTIRLADLSDEAERDRLRDRLFREAQSAGILSHPGIVVVYDVGEDGEITYIAMEFVNGPTLEKLLAAESPPSQQTVLNVLQQTAAALDYAHKKGIVHRDIKPANIMIDEGGTVKITDFGIAKISASHQLTQTGMVMGTPNYMSPEQVQGKPVDGKADQFSLGVVAYEMLTGERPFTGEQLTTVLYKIVSEEPAPVEHVNPTLGFAVSVVLSKALAKDPAKRYPTCAEFASALEAALKSKKGWQPLTRGAGQDLPTEVVASGLLAARPKAYTEPEPRKRGMAWRAIATGIAAMGAVGLLFVAAQKWLLTDHSGQEPVSAAQSVPAPQSPSKPPPMPRPTHTPQAVAPPLQTTPAETAGTAQTGAPEQAPPVSPPGVPAHTPAPPSVPAAAALQIVTQPAGASATLDNDPSKVCTSPCSFDVAPGRHTLAITLAGYRRELRIVDLNGPREVFVGMTQAAGTVRVESEPPGAEILIDNQPRSQKTPATFVLPAGKHVIAVIKDGRRAEQNVNVRDGALLTFNLEINP
jgi:serine/threonine protein kinase